MKESESLKQGLEIAARILIRCFFLNFALILVWFIFFVAGSSKWGYGLHSKIFDITSHEFVLINYCGMAFAKLCNLIFFLFPYIAIRLVLRPIRPER